MIPLTQNPKVVLLVNELGQPLQMATNVSQELEVITTQDPWVFSDESKGVTFSFGPENENMRRVI